MFVKDGVLYCDYNSLDGVPYILKSKPLGKGQVDVKFDFKRTKPFGGIGRLFINDEQVGEVEMPEMHISTYSLAQTFDIERDTGTQVSKMYNPFPYTGKLDRVVFRVSDEDTVPPRRAYY